MTKTFPGLTGPRLPEPDEPFVSEEPSEELPESDEPAED